jgi:hypothetical protein
MVKERTLEVGREGTGETEERLVKWSVKYRISITNSPGPGIGISACPISIAAPLEGIHAAWLLIFVMLGDLGQLQSAKFKG